jgi:hypothetical protein
VRIECKGKTILHVKNVACEMLYQSILKIVDKSRIFLSEDVHRLIEELDQAGYGIGCDIADFIKTKNDAIIFASLTREAIDLYKIEIPSVTTEAKERFENFHQELHKYAEELNE